MTHHKFDFLVIGSGLAGLYAALCAAEKGKVAIVSKSEFDMSSSYWAQGGIAAALDPNDSTESHMNDTLVAGRGLCSKNAVEVLVSEGKERIKDLMKLGMPFDTEKGKLALGLEGGHSFRRIVRAGGNSTGREIVRFLEDKVKRNDNIRVFDHTHVYRLIIKDKRCFGACAMDMNNHTKSIFSSKAVILATGGAAGIYSRNTNPRTSAGDGISLAYKAGCVVSDMEFIQFHPTAFYSDSGKTFLVSEAVRGEGAQLVNKDGVRFMLSSHPAAELAPRDVVSRSIYNELKSSGEKCVYLKMDHLNAAEIEIRFSNIFANAIQFGINITKDLIPVAPAAHYMIGGVKTNLNAETNISGLYACGETAATGVHGANRLASNSLLECLVFAKRAVNHAFQNLPDDIDFCANDSEFIYLKKNEQKYREIKENLSALLNSYVGIVRSDETIEYALRKIEEERAKLEYNPHEYFSLRLDSLVELCELIAKSAFLRRETRGVHIRENYKSEDSDLLYHIDLKLNSPPKFSPVN